MGIEREFNRSQALALDAENKMLMAEIERLRAELTRLLAKHGEQQTADVLANEQNGNDK